jgi:hypothetical protein
MAVSLRMTGLQHNEIKKHVLTQDGKEAATLLFCRPVLRKFDYILLVEKIEHIPYEVCTVRTNNYLSWPTEKILLPKVEKLEHEGLSLVMLHSHPNGFPKFSQTDDENDLEILERLASNIDGDQPHGSAIMLPDGEIKGRTLDENNRFIPMKKVLVAGDQIHIYLDRKIDCVKHLPGFIQKNSQIYGARIINYFRSLRIGIVGCSGTGSPMIELCMRYNVGELVLIDPDIVEEDNLNRLVLSRLVDAKNRVPKVEVYQRWQTESGLPTKVFTYKETVPSENTTVALSQCDIIFGCVDNVAARHSLNKIACAYLIPYFDLGVGVKMDNKIPKNLHHATVRCHYIQPDQSCLLDREAYSSERLAEENYQRDDPEFYKILKKAGYTGNNEEVQAVMVFTMEAAALGMDDLKARLLSYRVDSNKDFDQQDRSFTHGYYEHYSHSTKNVALRNFIATGDNHKKL